MFENHEFEIFLHAFRLRKNQRYLSETVTHSRLTWDQRSDQWRDGRLKFWSTQINYTNYLHFLSGFFK